MLIYFMQQIIKISIFIHNKQPSGMKGAVEIKLQNHKIENDSGGPKTILARIHRDLVGLTSG